MRTPTICLLLPLFLLGCSKKEKAESPAKALPGIPFQMTVTETSEMAEMNSVSNQAVSLLAARDYAGLDALAGKLRASRESYEGGAWKFYFVYPGLDLPESASDAQWKDRLEVLQNWVATRPDSITARVALANDLTSYAWKARGGGWGSSVTEEGGRLFEQRLSQASQILADAKSLKEKCPFYWSVILTTYLGLGADRSRYDETFTEATREWPEYSAYYNRRAYFLLPRWYGSGGEWENDLAKSADKLGAKDGDILYARVVWCMQQTGLFTNIFNESNLSWPRIDRGFTAIEERFPDSLAAVSEHAHLAVLARDKTVARKCFDRTKGKIDLSVWRSPQSFMQFAYWAYDGN